MHIVFWNRISIGHFEHRYKSQLLENEFFNIDCHFSGGGEGERGEDSLTEIALNETIDNANT